MKKILILLGTRPEAIKLASLIHTLQSRPQQFSAVTCSTAQHTTMLTQACQWLDISPDINLNLMTTNQRTGDFVATAQLAINQILHQQQPDWVIVQGDTATATAGALSGFYANIPVAHVEAGLRSHNRHAPWPEEVNRTLISRLATLHLAVTDKNTQTLIDEGVDGKIAKVGNTVIDALLYMQNKINTNPTLKATIQQNINAAGYPLQPQTPYILVTGHRRESFGEGLENICHALQTIAQQHPKMHIVYAVHLNPNVTSTVKKMLGNTPNIYLLPPLDYATFVYMMMHCHLILTDSGGIQEEAPTLNKPVLIMRAVTERQEVIECGAAQLVGTQADNIVTATCQVLNNPTLYQQMATAPNPFGDGTAAQKIADELTN